MLFEVDLYFDKQTGLMPLSQPAGGLSPLDKVINIFRSLFKFNVAAKGDFIQT